MGQGCTGDVLQSNKIQSYDGQKPRDQVPSGGSTDPHDLQSFAL